MGYPTMIYVSDDVREKLKEVENRSELVNNLLREHFKFTEDVQKTPEEIEKQIEILELQVETEKKIQELEKDGHIN
jgi:DNA-binding winged helix-turn-helix (wHTH) protein